MSKTHDTGRAEDFDLEHFERNRYFQGKLMTAHDMETEQAYHASRVETLTRLVSGAGIVSGLRIVEFDHEADELSVTIEPGVAIDNQGRPIVVRTPTTRTIPTGENDAVYLSLSYAEESKDPVPVPGVDTSDTGQSQESRVLEIFELVAKESPPQTYKRPPRIDLSSLAEIDDYAERASEIVAAYREAARSSRQGGIDNTVFLGAFERTADGEWQRKDDETKRRPAVYDNDMLFGLLVAQFGADRMRGDETTGGETIEGELNRIEAFVNRLDQLEDDVDTLREAIADDLDALGEELEAEISSTETAVRDDIANTESALEKRIERVDDELRSKIETAEDYLWTEVERNQNALQTQAKFSAYRSLTSSSRRFDEIANEFEHRAEISRLTLGIAESIQVAMAEQVDADPEAYEAFIAELLGEIDALVAALEEAATQESHARLADTADAVHDALAGETPFIEVVTAFDRLSQTATLLKPTYEVYPDDD